MEQPSSSADSGSNLEWLFSFSGGAGQNRGDVVVNGRDVLFHPILSTGTASCRSATPLSSSQHHHHFWEMVMTRPVYGTSVAVGVGVATENVDCDVGYGHLLGKDGHTWGYSYQGVVRHDGKKRLYGGKTWGQGSTLGIHLDLWRGTLEFYLDGNPLGIAFTNLPRNVPLFPMVSSTAAKSGFHLKSARSYPESLRFRTIKLIGEELRRNHSAGLCDLSLPPGLFALVNNNFAFLIGDGSSHVDVAKEELDCCDSDTTVRSFDLGNRRRSATVATKRRQTTLSRTDGSSSEDDLSEMFGVPSRQLNRRSTDNSSKSSVLSKNDIPKRILRGAAEEMSDSDSSGFLDTTSSSLPILKRVIEKKKKKCVKNVRRRK